jgi:hypothetical protein
MSDLSPLSGVERKLDFGDVRAVVDPDRTCACGGCNKSACVVVLSVQSG